MESTSDHEVNFLVKSKEIAAKTLDIFRVDLSLSKRVKNIGYLSINTLVKAAIHRVWAPVIG